MTLVLVLKGDTPLIAKKTPMGKPKHNDGMTQYNGLTPASGPKQWDQPGEWPETMGPTWQVVQNDGSNVRAGIAHL